MSVTTIPGITFDEEPVTQRKLNLWARPVFVIDEESIGEAEIEYTDADDGDFRKYVTTGTLSSDTASHKHFDMRLTHGALPFATAYVSINQATSLHPVGLKVGEVLMVCIRNTDVSNDHNITLLFPAGSAQDYDIVYTNGTPNVEANEYAFMFICLLDSSVFYPPDYVWAVMNLKNYA